MSLTLMFSMLCNLRKIIVSMLDWWGYKGSWFMKSQARTLEVWATETRVETSSDF